MVVEMSSRKDILYLSRADVEKLKIPARMVIQLVEKAFHKKAESKVEMPPKIGIHPQDNAFIHAMPAYIREMKSAGIKWISGFPKNPERGLPYISGLLILNDPETGIPLCVMDATWITAKRTGAVTAVAAKYLSRQDSRVLGILGCGVQGRSNLEALRAVCQGLEQVKAYDINSHNLHRYVEEMTAKHKLKIIPCTSPRKAVENCDIVVTTGPILKKPHPIIEPSWFKEGGLACPLDFDSYWKPEAMFSMDKFCTDDCDQLRYYTRIGYFSNVPAVYADLSEIVCGKKLGRENPEERIMSMNLGLAMEDMAVARPVYEKAKKNGIGTRLLL